MRRRRNLEDNERISLFPFLAVLICTMGALLVLLVVISERAQAKARAELAAQSQALDVNKADAQQQLEALQVRIEHLETQHAEVSDVLAERRNLLSHVEDHMVRLRDELIRLRRALQEIEQFQVRGGADLKKLEAELQRLTQQIAESEKLLAEAQAAVGRQQPSYAIIPFETLNETNRRPVYLECHKDSIVLQPEGIEFGESDFARPLGVDNPLATAMRAASEFFARENPDEIAQLGRAYPLLIVRPSSINAYYAARAALDSWGSDFGYELVGEDWDLKYPSADPRLARVVQDAVEIARRRRQMIQQLGAGGPGSGSSGGSYGGSYGGGGSGGGRGSSSGGTAPAEPLPGPGFGRLVPSTSRQPTGDGDLRFNESGDSQSRASEASQGSALGPDSNGTSSQAAGAAGSSSGSMASMSLAEARGNDWALPNASKGSVAMTRPIRVECSADRLVIPPGDTRSNWHVIAIDGPTQEVIEKFVSAVWDHMEGWGIAGRGVYWKPILHVYVYPGGEGRAADLTALLEKSGLEVSLRRP
jgi:hypothetical protein